MAKSSYPAADKLRHWPRDHTAGGYALAACLRQGGATLAQIAAAMNVGTKRPTPYDGDEAGNWLNASFAAKLFGFGMTVTGASVNRRYELVLPKGAVPPADTAFGRAYAKRKSDRAEGAAHKVTKPTGDRPTQAPAAIAASAADHSAE